MKKLVLLLVCALAFNLVLAQPFDGLLSYDHSGNDSLFLIDPQNGASLTGIQDNGGDDWMAMACDNDLQMVYAFSACGDFSGPAFYQFDLNTQIPVFISTLGGQVIFASAFDNNNDILYAVGMQDNGSNVPQTLYTVNPNTGNLSAIGALGVNGSDGFCSASGTGMQGLAYDTDLNVLFGLSADNNLYSIAPNTGVATLVGSIGVSNLRGLTYDFNLSKLYAVSSNETLYELDKTTGAVITTFPPQGSFSFCTSLTYLTSTTSPLPIADFNASDSTICAGDCIDFTDLSTSSATITSWGWDFGGGATNSTLQNPTNICFNTAGTYTVSLTVTDVNGTDTATEIGFITVLDNGDATINPAGPFCTNDPAINLSANTAGGTWTGTGITNTTNGTFDPSVAGAGTHSIIYSIPGSCGDTDTIDMIVNALDDASFNYPLTTYCITDTDPAPNITGNPGGTFSIDNGGSINPSTGVIDLDASGNGNYTITYSTTGACPATATANITITNALDATITQAGPFCSSDPTVTLSAVDAGGTWSGNGITDANLGTFNPSTAGAGTHTITYTIPGSCGDVGTIDITVNPSDVAAFNYPSSDYCLSENDPTPSMSGTLGGTFSINNGGVINPSTGTIDLDASGGGTFTITYTTSGPCPDSQDFIINISDGAAPTIELAGPFCLNDGNVSLTANVPGGTWTGIGILDPSTGLFNTDSAGVGTHQIIYTIPGPCGGADTIDIVVNAVPNANLAPSFTLDYGSSVTLGASGGGSYTWTPDTDLSCNDCASPVASPSQNTTYCVIVSQNGCLDTACTTVYVEYDCGDVVVPSAFTPNSGDINSSAWVLGNCITEMHFQIFDRWGELVFESFDPQIGWDGTHIRNGKPMSTAVFVYQVNGTLINGDTFELKGNITLIR